jgi:hypothetical protein
MSPKSEGAGIYRVLEILERGNGVTDLAKALALSVETIRRTAAAPLDEDH